MKIFKDTMMSTWDIGLLKTAIAFMAIAIGSTWPEVFGPYAMIMFAIGAIAGLYALYAWIRK